MVETNEQETSPAAPNVPAPDHSAPDERHPEAGFTATLMKPPEAPEPEPRQEPDDDGVPPAGPVTLKRTNGRKVVVVIDGEFRTRLRDQTEPERAAMERNLLRDRFMVVTVWATKSRRVVLDGHCGIATCLRYGIPVLLREVKLRDRAAARRWIDDNQNGRRNLTREEAAYTVGTLYNRTKLPHGGSHSGGGSSAKSRHSKTADALARRYHVAASTVRYAADYAAAVDEIARACGDGPRQLILGGDSGLTQKDVIELAQDVPGEAALRTAVLKYLSERAEPEGSLTGAEAEQAEKSGGKKTRKRVKAKARKASAPEALARAAGADGASLSGRSWAVASLNMCRELFRRLGKKPRAMAFAVFKTLGPKKAAAMLLELEELLATWRKRPADENDAV